MRELPVAEIGLDPVAEAERGVTTEREAEGLHDADHEDEERVPHDGIAVVGDDPVVDRRRREQRDGEARRGPDDRGQHCEPEQAHALAQRVGEEPPPAMPQVTFG